MSDFGAIIIFKKKSGLFTSDDRKKVEKELKKVITDKEFPSNITEGNFAKLRGWDEDNYCSIVTEYYEDEDADEIREFAEEEDVQDCERIIEKLRPILETDFEMVAKFEDW